MLTSTVNIYEVTGSSATEYTFNYPIHKSTDLTVYVSAVVVPASGGTNPHTITVAANKQSAVVAFTSAPGAVPLKFERTVAYTQETDLANNSLFDAESLETSLDNIVMQTQQAGRLTDASFGFDPSIATNDYDSTVAVATTLNKTKTQRASKALAFDADGDLTVSVEDIDAQIAATASSATAAAGSATAAAGSATAAANDLAEFQGIYRGSSTSTPGSPTDGDLWFDTNTGVNVMKAYNSDTSAWEQLTPSSSNQTAINAAVADQADIGVVAGLDTEIGLLGALNTEIGLIGTSGMAHGSTGDIKLVADIAANVTKVADIDANVTKVADIDSDVSDVADIDSNVTTVAGKDAEIGRIGTSAMAASIALIGTDAYAHASTGDIKLVADIAANVTKVADIDSNVSIVAGLGSSGADVTTVAGKATEIGRLGTAAAVADMALLGETAVITDMDLLGASGVIDDMETCADAISAINGASANATTASNAATAATASEVAARASAAAVSQTFDNFADVYLGSMADGATADSGTLTGASWAKDSSSIAFTGTTGTISLGQELTSTGSGYPVGANIIGSSVSTPLTISNPFTSAGSGTLTFVGSGVYGAYHVSKDGPSTDNDGDALATGMLYFNTSDNEMRIYDGGNWIAASAAGSNSFLHYKYVASGSQTSFTGSDANGSTLSYTVNNIIVFLNGVRLDTTDYTATNGTSIVLDDGAAASDELVIISLKSFTAADMVPATAGGTFGGAVTHTGLLTANGGIETDINSKVVQKGAFMQSSTHQALTLGY